jgi:hypothetical protein
MARQGGRAGEAFQARGRRSTPPSPRIHPRRRRYCLTRSAAPTARSTWLTAAAGATKASRVEEFEDPATVIAHRDDHNPFFLISYALNAWIMVQALGLDLLSTRVLHLDTGFSSPIDTRYSPRPNRACLSRSRVSRACTSCTSSRSTFSSRCWPRYSRFPTDR